MLQDGFFDESKPTIIRWGELPHWRQDGALYFVTFRLADSLPAALLDQWRRERDIWRRLHPDPTPMQLEDFERMYRGRIETWLDRGVGSCILRQPSAKAIVQQALRYFDGNRYELGEWAVAGNHVHLTARTLPGIDLSSILGSLKRFASRKIRKITGCHKQFPALRDHLWQHESFDHIVRSQAHLDYYHRYIRNHDRRRQQ
ncbi:MAG: transposase [Thermoanaerobaculia bacterium]